MSFARATVEKMRGMLPSVNFDDRQTVVDNLFFMERVIVASVPLMAKASGTQDRALAGYYANHIGEEAGHHEWLKEDLEGETSIVLPILETLASWLVGSQYYRLAHNSDGATALLGYVLALEAFPMPLETVAALNDAYGPKLFRTLQIHAENDPAHLEDLCAIIEAQPAERWGAIEANAIGTMMTIRHAAELFGKTSL